MFNKNKIGQVYVQVYGQLMLSMTLEAAFFLATNDCLLLAYLELLPSNCTTEPRDCMVHTVVWSARSLLAGINFPAWSSTLYCSIVLDYCSARATRVVGVPENPKPNHRLRHILLTNYPEISNSRGALLN